jgi:hypothetical protein
LAWLGGERLLKYIVKANNTMKATWIKASDLDVQMYIAKIKSSL